MAAISNEDSGAARTGQPPHVLAAWIRELLGEIETIQLRKLQQLRERIESRGPDRESAQMGQTVAQLHSAAPELQFTGLRLGWLDVAMGRQKNVAARFCAAYERVAACVATLKLNMREAVATHKDHITATRRVLVELDLECKELGIEMEQGLGWLQELWAELNLRRQLADKDPKLAVFAQAAEAYTKGFKRLQSVTAVAREISVRGQHLIERRSALLEQVRADLEFSEKRWDRRVGALADDMRAGKTSPVGVPEAMEVHEELMKRLAAAVDASSALQNEEQLMEEQLGMLRTAIESRR